MAQDIRFDIRAMDKTAKAFKSVQGRVGKLTKNLGGLKTALAGAAGAAAFAKLASSGDQMIKFADRIGVTVESISTLNFVAERSGVSMDVLSRALQQGARQISEAAQGTGTAADALKELGLDAERLNLMSPDKQLNEIAKAMESVEVRGDKVRIAMDIFGRSGSELLQIMDGTQESIGQLSDKVESLGGVMSRQQAETFAEYEDAVTNLKTAFAGIGRTLAAVVAPAITFVIEKFAQFFGAVARGLQSLAEFLGLSEKQVDQLDSLASSTGRVVTITYDAAGANDELSTSADKVTRSVSDLREQYEMTLTPMMQFAVASQDVMQGLEDATFKGIGALEDGLVGIVNGTKSAKDAFKDMANSIVNDLIRILIQKQITGVIAGAFGNFFSPGAGPETLSFEGGGFTGAGSRSGGVDGKGGFPAILHPNETVVDHTKGQSGGVVVQQTINVTTGVQQTVRTEIANMLPQIAEASKAAVLDARKRGGSFAGAF